LTFDDLDLCCAAGLVPVPVPFPFPCHDYDHDLDHDLLYACCGSVSAIVFSVFGFAHADAPDCGFGFGFGFGFGCAFDTDVCHVDSGSAPLLPQTTLPERLVAGG
jgi:hypothetical protein